MSTDQQLSLLAIVSTLPLHATVLSMKFYNVNFLKKAPKYIVHNLTCKCWAQPKNIYIYFQVLVSAASID